MISQSTVQKWSIRKFFRLRSRIHLGARTTFQEDLFPLSKPLEDAYPRPIDGFTIMLCRVPLQDGGAQDALERLYRDVAVIQTLNNCSMRSVSDSPIGHYATLVFPECLPERL